MIDRNPREVWKWFEAISEIPRASGNEKAVSDFVVEFARERGLPVWQDKLNNVIIHKKASSGFEDKPTVILQGHLDMVPEKSKNSTHDFSKDPIELIVEGDFLHANHTTLGGDDGIAIAMMLAILDDNSLKHPRLECVMTTSEETGMDGVLGLTDEHLSGKYLINIDSEEEGIFLTSSAGGIHITNTFGKFGAMLSLTEDRSSYKAILIKVSGLTGGHSGMEIVKQRGNAIKILGRLLYKMQNRNIMLLANLSGGSKHNAIPLEAEVVAITTKEKYMKENIEVLERERELVLDEIRTTDPDAKIEFEKVEVPKEDMGYYSTDRIIKFLYLVPNGVIEFSRDIPGLVQTSANVAIIQNCENTYKILTSVRGSKKSSMDDFVQHIAELTSILETKKMETSDGYPAWEYEKDSKLRDIACEVYENLTGKKAVLTAIHAGLECGILKKLLPDTEMISMGPNMYDVHTEKERIDIPSAERFWEYLKKLLEKIE